MANGGGDFDTGIARAKAKESNTQMQGRSGGRSMELMNPVPVKKNKTMSGGINRSTSKNLSRG